MFFLHKIEFSIFIAIIVCYGVYLTQCGTLTSINYKPCKMSCPSVVYIIIWITTYFSGAILLGKKYHVCIMEIMYHKSCALCYMGSHAELETNIARMTEEVYM